MLSDARAASNERIERIRAALNVLQLDACYIRELPNIAWATAFDGVFDEEPAHALLVTPDHVFLHSDSRYAQALEQASNDFPIEVVIGGGSHAQFLVEHVSAASSVAIEDTLSIREFRQLDQAVAKGKGKIALCVEENLVEGLRQIKDDLEIALMRRAQKITDEAFSFICDFIQLGMTEVQVQRALDAFMFDAGADGLAFPTIVAAGSHAASPHAIPGDRPFQRGDAVVMDFGARYQGYCSDMTRTVFIQEASEEMQRAWKTLQEANESCEAAIRAGKTGAEIHQLAEDILKARGFEGCMGHGLGHSLGLVVHESPTLSLHNTDPLPSGALVTVEPGIYIPGKFGMRLEDFGLITDEGFEVLTQSTHDMVIIEPNMR